jgi:hypothetical protein
MSSYDRLIRDLTRETRAPDEAVDALHDRLRRGELASHAPLTELDGIGSASEDRVEALRRRVQAPAPRRIRWALPAFAAVSAVAAVMLWPEAPSTEPVDVPLAVASPIEEPEPEGLSGSVVAELLESTGSTTLPNHISVDWEGTGQLHSEGPDSDIIWTSGRVRLEVPPGAGLSVAVRTPDARVDVVGTVFSVVRDAEGTHTTVERGKVRVTCAGEEPLFVTPGEGATCQRKRASQMLAAARRLEARGATIPTILDVLNAALLDPTAPAPIRQELLFQSAVWLERSEDVAGARQRLHECVALGDGLRAPDAEAMLVRLGD